VEGIRAVLFDLDGTIYEHAVALPGAVEAVSTLRSRGLEVGFVTNTTSRSRRHLVERLRAMEIPVAESGVSSALVAGAAHLAERGHRRISAFVPDLALEDLAGFEITHDRPEAVVIGDLDDRWDFNLLNTAFNQLMQGAELVALSRDRYWQKEDGLVLDAGAFVAALEYASGRSASLTGKPAPGFYRAALGTLGPWALEHPDRVLMVGDDVWGDVEGAQRAGLRGCLVRTGKFRAEVLAASGVQPDLIVAAAADLPSAL
jgi:phospholysine phosphohistidine inorganic pyrophosphate phosphatase